MDAAFRSAVITFDCIGPGFPFWYGEAGEGAHINIIEFTNLTSGVCIPATAASRIIVYSFAGTLGWVG